MAGRGPAPKEQRANPHDKPIRGEWQPAEGEGWQHGDIPEPPEDMCKAAVEAWETWFKAWFAAFWGPEDIPMIRQAARMYDRVERNEVGVNGVSELRQLLDGLGATKKGQQDRRWKPPKREDTPEAAGDVPEDRYGHLSVVEGA